jgi:hypothetical protein
MRRTAVVLALGLAASGVLVSVPQACAAIIPVGSSAGARPPVGGDALCTGFASGEDSDG